VWLARGVAWALFKLAITFVIGTVEAHGDDGHPMIGMAFSARIRAYPRAAAKVLEQVKI